ncbi:8-amino-7-oxononanoate synthase [Platysternon megacephalum]|uniref:8-amino-7-oxononanoate synthase n=1 Tax=Platysternon megacephalum TaxID=55544 RepID=A0A4D9DGY7_9SAUR|nr:8-amino-7-oxononanoate synthase [Platysternon megacephalum]
MMKPYTNWEESLKPASIVITNMEQLTSISVGGGDVFINENLSELPKSFAAFLAQVNIEVWWSLNNTQKIMNKINGHFIDVPRKMAETVLDFSQEEAGKTSSVSQLDYIQITSEKCNDLTRALKNTFCPVISLIEKLLQACENAKQGYEVKLTSVWKLKADIRVKPVKEESEQERRKRKQQLEDDFQKYVEAIPTSGKSVGMFFLQSLKKCLTDPGVALGSVFTEQDGTEMTDNAFLEVKEKREKLMSTLEEEERTFQSIKKQNEEMMKTECDIKKYEAEEEELEIAGRILGQAVEALKSMKKQWDNILPFFETVSSQIGSCFREYLDSVKRFQQLTSSSTMDPIYIQAFRASSMAQFVYGISDTYVEASNKRLMPLLEELKRISTQSSYDSFKSRNKIEETQRNISSLVQEKEEEFKNNVKDQMEIIKKKIRAKQLPVSAEKLKKIEDAMQQALRKLSMQ